MSWLCFRSASPTDDPKDIVVCAVYDSIPDQVESQTYSSLYLFAVNKL